MLILRIKIIGNVKVLTFMFAVHVLFLHLHGALNCVMNVCKWLLPSFVGIKAQKEGKYDQRYSTADEIICTCTLQLL